MKLCFRFGLPLGSAFLTAVILDTTIGFYWLLMDGGSLYYFNQYHDVNLDFKLIFGISCFTTRALLAICLWIFIIMRCRALLLFWVPLSVITDLMILAHGIRHQTHNLSDEIWFLSLACIFLYRSYITCVVVQCAHRLLKNEVHDIEDQTLDSKYETLEPLGKPIGSIWTYYDENPSMGARVLIATEITWNTFCLLSHYFTEFQLAGRLFFMVKEEEIIIRIWRIFLDLAATMMVVHWKKTLLRFWLVVFFWTLFASLFVYAYKLIEWSHDTPYIIYCVSFFICLGDNFLRSLVLYFCLKVTTLPNEEVLSRVSSLRSQSSSRRSAPR